MQSQSNSSFKGLESSERNVALILGIIFLFVGIAGFLPGFVSLPIGAPDVPVDVPRLTFDDGYGNVLGLFPTNYLHNAVHIVVGILGIAAATSLGGSLTYNRIFAISYIGIALLGIIPFTNNTLGLMPIWGNNVWFNAVTGAIAYYYGFIKPAKAMDISKTPSNSPSV
jgi:hypothetical protein